MVSPTLFRPGWEASAQCRLTQLNLAGFNEDEAENALRRRRFLKLFDGGMDAHWLLANARCREYGPFAISDDARLDTENYDAHGHRNHPAYTARR